MQSAPVAIMDATPTGSVHKSRIVCAVEEVVCVCFEERTEWWCMCLRRLV